MTDVSIGKLRGLQQIASAQGRLNMVALDHRGALRRALNRESPEAVTYQDMVDFKLDICRATASYASAVLLDPEYGAAQAIATGALPGHVGLLVSLEESGYSGEKAARVTRVLTDWSPGKIRRMGAAAAKLLVYFRPDLKELAARQLRLVADLANECLIEDIPLLVEPLTYPLAESEAGLRSYAAMLPELAIETARQITALPIDILKTEFPADMRFEKDEKRLLECCQELDRASRRPWVLLSAGAEYSVFKRQLEIACQAGASGFLAGRALWQEATRLREREERVEFFRSVTVARLRELIDITARLGKPWWARLGSGEGGFGPVPEHWYRRYP